MSSSNPKHEPSSNTPSQARPRPAAVAARPAVAGALLPRLRGAGTIGWDVALVGGELSRDPSNVDTMAGQEVAQGRAEFSNVDTNAESTATSGHRSASSPKPSGRPGKVPGMPSLGGVDVKPESAPQPRRVPGGMPRKPGSPTPFSVRPSDEALRDIRNSAKAELERAAKRRRDGHNGTATAPKRAASTVAMYHKRGEDLVKRFRRERGLSSDVEAFDPVEFAHWCRGLRYSVAPSTWRQYRQAILMVLEPLASEKVEEAIALIENDDRGDIEMGTAEAVTKDEVPDESRRLTSAKKAKQVSFDEFQRLLLYLKVRRRSKNAEILRAWMIAGISTGLRPGEWQATELRIFPMTGPESSGVGVPPDKRRKAFLFVMNAKTTNGRGNGLVRTLDLTFCSDAALSAIRRMSETGRHWYAEGRFSDEMENVARTLYLSGKQIFRKKKLQISLYTFRHQFIANMKALDLLPEEISAMVGHVSDETAAHTYGKKRSSWSIDRILERPRPIHEEVQSVRRTLRFHQDRITFDRIVRGERVGSDAIKGALPD